MEITKKRDISIDSIRGVAIILVVIGHVCQRVEGTEPNLLHIIIQTIQMPLFMFLSGFCAFYSIQNMKCSNFLEKKAKGLLLPYIVWVILLWLSNGILAYGEFDLKQLMLDFLNSGFWFLRILFYINLLLVVNYFINGILKQIMSKYAFFSWVGVLLLAVVISRMPGCWNLYKHFIFFLMGLLVHWLESTNNAYIVNRRKCGVLCGASYAVGVLISINCSANIIAKLADYSAAFTGTLAIYFIGKLIFEKNIYKKNEKEYFFLYWTKNTRHIFNSLVYVILAGSGI